jgi:Tol biopolymer transport system component
MTFILERQGGVTTIERVVDGARWTVTGGSGSSSGESPSSVTLSPDRTRIAWQTSNNDLPFEQRVSQVWVSDLDGSDAQQVASLTRGGLSGWITHDVLLVSSRESRQSREQILSALSIATGQMVEIVRSERLGGTLLSRDGSWIAYTVTLHPDPTQNGLWLARTDGTERRRVEGELFGSYQWRDGHRLLIVPLRPNATSHELWEVDAERHEARPLTDPAVTPFKIANANWAVSPDGEHAVFVESQDRNLWLLTLPGR